MTTDQFVHLHVHTEYSMLDGAAQVVPLIKRVVELGQPAVAQTDHGVMFGAFEFWEVAEKHGVKPILGIEAYVAPASRFHKKPVFWGESGQRSTSETGEGGDVSGAGAFTHMTMLARNVTGLRNLYTLSSVSYDRDAFYRKQRMDTDLIADHADGIIATTGCPSGEVQTRLRLGQTRQAVEAAATYRDIFGADNYYVELMDHGLPIERSVRAGLLDIARQLSLKPVATNDSHYVTEDQAEAHAALLCVQAGKTLSDPDRFKFDGTGYYVKTAAEMRAYWDSEVPGAADATLEIAERVESYADAFAARDLMPAFDIWSVTPLMRSARATLNVRLVGDVDPAAVAAARPLVVRVERVDAFDTLRDAFTANQGGTPVCVVLCEPDGDRAGTETVVSAGDFPVTVSGDLLRALHGIKGVTVT